MEEAWGAKVYDHVGATEIGAWGFECTEQPGGLHVNEALFLTQLEDIETGELIEEPGRKGKIVITALDRECSTLHPVRFQGCGRMVSGSLPLWEDLPYHQGRGRGKGR